LLKLEGISVYYGVIPAVRNISIKIDSGQIVAIVGANGAGKTTTLKTIMGVLKPKTGKIIYNGMNIIKYPPNKRVQLGITLIPEGRQIFTTLTVKENLLLGAYHRRDVNAVKEDLEWIYNLFPILKERENQIAGTLSGGEQQMLAIGRGLMSRPKLLMIDEPSLGLAPKIIGSLYQAIKEINDHGVTILLVEQNVKMAMKLADYMYVMETGEIKAEGKPYEVMKSEDIRRAYLGG